MLVFVFLTAGTNFRLCFSNNNVHVAWILLQPISLLYPSKKKKKCWEDQQRSWQHDSYQHCTGEEGAKFINCHSYTRVHYTHAAANLNSGYSKYTKVALVHYFCTIALQTSCAVLTRTWASRRVDLRERRVDLFSKRVIIFCWWHLNDF